MDVPEFLIGRIQKAMGMLFAAARKLPPDKLDWKPAPGARSALDQLQEVATSVDAFWAAHAERKVDWSEAKMAAWASERQKLKTIDEIEAHAKAGFDRLYAYIRTVKPEQWTDKVEMPFPGDYDLAYILGYYFYNAAYHEGQINYIGSLIEP